MILAKVAAVRFLFITVLRYSILLCNTSIYFSGNQFPFLQYVRLNFVLFKSFQVGSGKEHVACPENSNGFLKLLRGQSHKISKKFL
jgi:hypothetical protein